MTDPPELTRFSELSRALAEYRGGESPDRALDRARRRRLGAYFTPLPLVEFTVGETLSARLAEADVCWREDGSPALRVLDPCAGDGRFLIAAADYLSDRAVVENAAPDGDRARARAAIIRRCLIAIERDPEFAEVTRQALGSDMAVFIEDALHSSPTPAPAPRGPALATTVDVVIGNPPYVRSINMDPHERSALAGRYAATSYGEWDLYMAFLEQAYYWLAPHGHAGLVVPSRWFTTATARELRRALIDAGALRMLVDFGAAQVFAEATTYTSVSFLTKTRQTQVFIARRSSGDESAGWQCGHLPISELSGAAWRLAVGEDRALVHQFGGGPTLGDIARIAKGAGTNADRVYVLERASATEEHVRGHCRAANEQVQVERAICRPCVRGRDVRAYQPIDGTVQCLTPYRRDGTQLTPAELSHYPLAAAHLARFRARLGARESGKYAGPTFYRFGRAQNMAFLGDIQAKIVIPDVAKGGRATIDHSGALVLDSAYAIRLLPADQGYTLALLLAILHAPIVRYWLTHTGIPLRGGYVRLKTAYLSSLPLPPLSAATERAQTLVRSGLARGLVDARAIDQAIQTSYGLSAQAWQRVAST